MFIDRLGLERIDIWKDLVVQSANWRSLIGQGMGKFASLGVIDKTGTYWDNPHNEYLQVYFELGLIGLLLLLGYFIDLFRRFLRFKTPQTILLFSCITVLLINSLGMFPMQVAPTAFLAITYIGLLEVCLNRKNK